ncbi:hypothetical protein [Actinomadura sp. 21ATH]|uniref:hypothetical protein n=1 Tax=Actinomadura sp. 21ATH TaxID=1735444 RepID=UPI0035C020DC
MHGARAHPRGQGSPWDAPRAAEYGRYASVADLLRQIGHDERVHKQDSLVHIRAPRFHQAP